MLGNGLSNPNQGWHRIWNPVLWPPNLVNIQDLKVDNIGECRYTRQWVKQCYIILLWSNSYLLELSVFSAYFIKNVFLLFIPFKKNCTECLRHLKTVKYNGSFDRIWSFSHPSSSPTNSAFLSVSSNPGKNAVYYLWQCYCSDSLSDSRMWSWNETGPSFKGQ